ncbi:MAG: serine/threonine-protein kinase [Planctomycetota bacterium]
MRSDERDGDERSRVLQELFRAREEGQEPDLEGLAARLSGEREEIERLDEAVRRYRDLAAELHRPAPGPADLGPGDRLGDFEIEGPLARGGMGAVYRARQRSLGGRAVALKALPLGAWDERRRARFEREALLLAGLHHEHLAEVHGFGEDGGHLFYAMRLVEGPTLADALDVLVSLGDRSALPAIRRETVRWGAQVASALAAVHRRGLVHRDVKPANVVLEGADPARPWAAPARAVLVDFGLVHPLGDGDARLPTVAGATVGYAPPEQLLGGAVAPAADVFSLGATLHDLCAPRTPAQRGQASLGLEPLAELDPTMDPDLAAIVAKAADVEPAWRYPDGGAMLADLEAWLAGRPVAARRPPLAERARRWTRRNPQRILRSGVWVVGVAGAVLAAGWLARAGGEAEDLRRAVEAGDIQGAVEGARSLPSFLHPLLLPEAEVRDVARRARRGDEQDPLHEVFCALDRHDPQEALFLAARALHAQGLPGDPPLLSRFLWRSLPAVEPESAYEAAALRWSALLLSAFYDTEDAPVDVDGEFRSRFRAVFLHSPGRRSRLFALQGLSASGTPADARELLEWALAQDFRGEEQRMGLQAVERIVRWLHRAGRLRELDLATIGNGLAEYAPRALGGEGELGPSEEHWARNATEDLACAFLLAKRSLGEPFDAASLLTERDRERLQAEGLCSGRALCILAGGGDSRVDAILASSPERLRALPAEVSLSNYRLGWGYGARGDTPALAEACERYRTELEGHELAEFCRHLEDGRSARRGDRPELKARTNIFRGDRGGEPFPLEVERSTLPPSPEARAWWSFGGGRPQAGGLASGVRAESALLADVRHSDSYLHLRDPGGSRLHLLFQVSSAEGLPNLALDLFCQSEADRYAPYAGECHLTLHLDGRALDERRLVPECHGVLTTWLLPGELLLRPGEHAITITLDAASTTSCWLHEARIRPG